MNQDPIISKIINYTNLSVEKKKHELYEQLMEYQPTIPILEENALVGLEIEAEQIKTFVPLEYYWSGKDDNSLRYYGKEFVSIPLRMKQVENALKYLNIQLNTYVPRFEFSPRCSVHVHLNVRDMTWDQIKTLILLYAIFERHFFHIAGTKRETSVFCVPIYKTQALKALWKLETSGMKWHKYAAINPGTILGNDDVSRYGTLEFRHLYGTNNVETIIKWLNNIMCLRRACRNYTFEELCEKVKSLNTTSEYAGMYAQIFGEYANTWLMGKYDFEHCVSRAKLALWGNDWTINYKLNLLSAYEKAYINTKNKPNNPKEAWVINPYHHPLTEFQQAFENQQALINILQEGT